MDRYLELLIGRSALESVLPETYARYRQPVREALELFIASLEPLQRVEVMQQQAFLPPAATAAQRLAALARSCPALHKLGQSLARERRLSAEFRGHLQQLESLAPSVDTQIVRDQLEKEIGSLESLGITLLPAIAEASVAVVVPFLWDQDSHRQGVFKVLKPGIQERLASELDILEKVGCYLDERCAEFDLPKIDYRNTFDQLRTKLLHEVRLDVEQRHLVMAAEFFSGDSWVHIPSLYPFCTPRITAMERIRGEKVTEHRLKGFSKIRLAERVIRCLISRPVLSNQTVSFFHADPHAGNMMLTEDGALAVLDWSLVGHLGERERAAMVQVLLAALTFDADTIVRTLLNLNISKHCQPSTLHAVAVAGLRKIRQLQPPGFTWLTGLLDEAVQSAGLGLEADLVLFRKSLHSLEGVLSDIGALSGMADLVLIRDFISQLLREWPQRLIKPCFSRSFATRLSNADLLGLAISFPVAFERYLALG